MSKKPLLPLLGIMAGMFLITGLTMASFGNTTFFGIKNNAGAATPLMDSKTSTLKKNPPPPQTQSTTGDRFFSTGGGYLAWNFNWVLSSVNGSLWTPIQSNAPWLGRVNHNTVFFNNQLFLMSGWRHQYGRLADVWSSFDGIYWTQVTPYAPWAHRLGASVLVFNNQMWIMGGLKKYNPPAFLNDLWVTPDGDGWTHVVPGNTVWSPREFFGTAVFQNKMWVLGGMNQTLLGDVWSSPDGSNWDQEVVSAPWGPRTQFKTLVFDNKLWVIGGQSVPGGGVSNDVWSSLDGVSWTQVTQHAAWGPRYDLEAFVFNDKMWVVGGQGNPSAYNDAWSSSDGITWVQETNTLTSHIQGLAHHAIAVTPHSFGLSDLQIISVTPDPASLHQSTLYPQIAYDFTVKNTSLATLTIPVTAKFSLYKLNGPGFIGLVGQISPTAPATVLPDQTYTFHAKSRMDIGLRSMTGFSNYKLVADDSNIIEETDETNNTFTFGITIIP